MIMLIIFLLQILTPSLTFLYPGQSSHTVWKANIIIIQYAIWSQYASVVDTIPPLEKQKEVKSNIKKGTTLIEDLNILLDEIKGKLQKGGNVDKSTLSEAMNIKDKFKQCQLQSDDLPLELIDSFKKRILETFVMILMNENTANLLGNVKPKESKNSFIQETNDVKHNPEEL